MANLAAEVSGGVVPQEVIPQGIGWRGVANLLQVRRLAEQEPESAADGPVEVVRCLATC